MSDALLDQARSNPDPISSVDSSPRQGHCRGGGRGVDSKFIAAAVITCAKSHVNLLAMRGIFDPFKVLMVLAQCE